MTSRHPPLHILQHSECDYERDDGQLLLSKVPTRRAAASREQEREKGRCWAGAMIDPHTRSPAHSDEILSIFNICNNIRLQVKPIYRRRRAAANNEFGIKLWLTQLKADAHHERELFKKCDLIYPYPSFNNIDIISKLFIF